MCNQAEDTTGKKHRKRWAAFAMLSCAGSVAALLAVVTRVPPPRVPTMTASADAWASVASHQRLSMARGLFADGRRLGLRSHLGDDGARAARLHPRARAWKSRQHCPAGSYARACRACEITGSLRSACTRRAHGAHTLHALGNRLTTCNITGTRLTRGLVHDCGMDHNAPPCCGTSSERHIHDFITHGVEDTCRLRLSKEVGQVVVGAHDPGRALVTAAAHPPTQMAKQRQPKATLQASLVEQRSGGPGSCP